MKKNLLFAGAALAVLIQFFPAPAKSNPPVAPTRTVAAALKPPPPVLAILTRACYDCHSNETKWPWYSGVAPVSWFVRGHVIDGRKHLNFSEWLKPGENSFRAWSDLEEICVQVRKNAMPLPGYDWLHPEARLTAADRQAVCAWVDAAIGAAR